MAEQFIYASEFREAAGPPLDREGRSPVAPSGSYGRLGIFEGFLACPAPRHCDYCLKQQGPNRCPLPVVFGQCFRLLKSVQS
jgi:hypothetical protein